MYISVHIDLHMCVYMYFWIVTLTGFCIDVICRRGGTEVCIVCKLQLMMLVGGWVYI